MAKHKRKPVPGPPIPPSFFLQFTPVQLKSIRTLLKAFRVHYNDYNNFRGEIFKQSGFIYQLWHVRLMQEVVLPAGMSKNMFRVFLFVWALKTSPKYKNEMLTMKLIVKESIIMGKVARLWPERNMRYLEKYGWIRSTRIRMNAKQYFLSEQGIKLIQDYTIRYSQMFNEFFEPLSLS